MGLKDWLPLNIIFSSILPFLLLVQMKRSSFIHSFHRIGEVENLGSKTVGSPEDLTNIPLNDPEQPEEPKEKPKGEPKSAAVNWHWIVIILIFCLGGALLLTSLITINYCHRTLNDQPCTIRSWKASDQNPPFPFSNCTLENVQMVETANYFTYENELLLQATDCVESKFSLRYCQSTYDPICNQEKPCLVTKKYTPCSSTLQGCETCGDGQQHFIVQGKEKCNDFFCFGLGEPHEILPTSSTCECPGYCKILALGCPSDKTRYNLDGWTRGLKTPLAMLSILLICIGIVVRPMENVNPIAILRRIFQFIFLLTTIIYVIESLFGYCTAEKDIDVSTLAEDNEISWFDTTMMFPNLEDDRDDPLICPTGAFYFFIGGLLCGVVSWFIEQIFFCF